MKRLRPQKRPISPDYRQVWRVVDGAVALALTSHPEYLAPRIDAKTVRNSIVKRVVGAITGYAEQSAWVRSGSSPADTSVGAALHGQPTTGAGCAAPPGELALREVCQPEGELACRSPSFRYRYRYKLTCRFVRGPLVGSIFDFVSRDRYASREGALAHCGELFPINHEYDSIRGRYRIRYRIIAHVIEEVQECPDNG